MRLRMLLPKWRLSTYVWVGLSLAFLFVGRLLTPTHIEWTWTAFYKDFAHIFWGCMVTYALMRRSYQIYIEGKDKQLLEVTTWQPNYPLFWFAWAFAVFELGMAFLT